MRTAEPISARFMLAVAQFIRGVAALRSGENDDAHEHLRRMFDPADGFWLIDAVEHPINKESLKGRGDAALFLIKLA